MAITGNQDENAGTAWLVPPDISSGLRIKLNELIEADQLSPEIIAILGKLMAELQQTARITAGKGCPKLASCQEFTGDCSKLELCGTYKVAIITSP